MAAETKPAAASGVAREMEVEAYRRLFPVAFLERHLGESVRIGSRRLREARAPPPSASAPSPPRMAMLASVKLEVMSPPAEHSDEGSVAVEFHMSPICSPLKRRQGIFGGGRRFHSLAVADIQNHLALRNQSGNKKNPTGCVNTPTKYNKAGSALARLGDTAMLASVKLEVMSPPAEHPDEGSVAVEFHMPPICSPLVRPGRPADVAPVISKALEDVLTRGPPIVPLCKKHLADERVFV
ncbi:Exosome complex component RRP43 [Zea mays]|uniref:Ribosomal RNA-processing protein 43 n=1 Tax=Zea mays TaxID=4577 RepID=A0A3L6F4N3_MAIZE|nr:Exosome complex component RRP43 [Zea mays]